MRNSHQTGRTAHEADPLLTTEGVLAMFHSVGLSDLNIRAIDRLCSAKKLPFVKVGQRRRFRRSAIQHYLDDLYNAA